MPTPSCSGHVVVVRLLTVHRVYELARHSAPVHALIFRHGLPVPTLGGELYGIPLSIFVKFNTVGPEPLPDTVRVLCPHGNRHNRNSVAEDESLAIQRMPRRVEPGRKQGLIGGGGLGGDGSVPI